MTRLTAILMTTAFVAASMLAITGAQADEWQNRLETEDGITEDEWQEGFDEAGVFDEWDEDGDGRLSEEEFGAATYDLYDQNDDDMIDEDEFARAEEDEFLGMF